MVEHAAVNRVVEGSSPSSGAIRLGLRFTPALAHGRPFWHPFVQSLDIPQAESNGPEQAGR